MLAIIAYAVGIMYSPGPVNLMGLNTGVNGQAKRRWGFCLGVGTAMLLLFLLSAGRVLRGLMGAYSSRLAFSAVVILFTLPYTLRERALTLMPYPARHSPFAIVTASFCNC